MSSLSWEIPLSGLIHGLLLAAFTLFGTCAVHQTAPAKVEDVLYIELGGPARQTTALPQKAERTPDPVRTTPGTAPPPVTNTQALRLPDTPPVTGDPKADKQRESLINDLRRQAALKDLSAPLGTVDRARTDVNGSEDVGTGSASAGDPELRKWAEKAKKLIAANWHPLQTLCQQNGGLKVTVEVVVDANGTQTDPVEVKHSSSNSSFDASARRAAEMTTQLPAVPTRFSGGLDVMLDFTCQDAT